MACLAAGASLAQDAPARPWRLVSWSSSLGSQSSTYEIMYGLKSFLAFLNANGGLGGRELQLYTLEMDDSNPDFLDKLDSLVIQGQPDLVVGGASQLRGASTAEYFRRTARPWFGPWSGEPDIYAGGDDDPAGILPTTPVQLAMLFNYAKPRLAPGRILYFVYREGPRAQELAQLAAAQARTSGVEMRPLRLGIYFRDWEALRGSFPDAGAVALWTAPGPAAAIRRIVGPDLGQEVVWMTHALNPTGREVLGLTGGLWAGTLFPAILQPSERIPEAYSLVISKYALPGLRMGYRTYMGFTQGQLLAKGIALASDRSQTTPGGVLRALKDLPTSGSLYQGDRLPANPADQAGAYLAVADPLGGWYPAQ
jgi:hypothetical protein